MTVQLPAQPHVRGPLRFDITTSSPQLEAGNPFSLYVKVTNPYDFPVQVARTRSRLPVEFRSTRRTRSTSSSSRWQWLSALNPIKMTLSFAEVGEDVEATTPQPEPAAGQPGAPVQSPPEEATILYP